MKWWIKAVENKKQKLYSFTEKEAMEFLNKFIADHGSIRTKSDYYVDDVYYGKEYSSQYSKKEKRKT